MARTQITGAAVGAFAAAALAACSPVATPAADSAKDVAAVKALENQAAVAANAHQNAKFGALYAGDGVVYFAGAQPAIGPDAITRSMAPFNVDKAYNFKIVIDRVEVAKSGDIAYAVWHYDQASTDPKTRAVVHELGNGIDTLRKGADGTWKFVVSMDGPGAPPTKP